MFFIQQQHVPKNQNSTNNQSEDNKCLTSPDKMHMPTIQKSPSESISSKTDTEKARSGKSRNKEGSVHCIYCRFSNFIYFHMCKFLFTTL